MSSLNTKTRLWSNSACSFNMSYSSPCSCPRVAINRKSCTCVFSGYLYGPMAAGADGVLTIFLFSADMFPWGVFTKPSYNSEWLWMGSSSGKWECKRNSCCRKVYRYVCQRAHAAFLEEFSWTWHAGRKMVAPIVEELWRDRCFMVITVIVQKSEGRVI